MPEGFLMPVKLTNIKDHVNEGSTCSITAVFTDEKGDSVTPVSITWTLTDVAGQIINGRENMPESPAGELTVVLSGDDLGISMGEKAVKPGARVPYVLRVLTIDATYNSSLGTGLPLREQLTFAVDIMTVDHDGV